MRWFPSVLLFLMSVSAHSATVVVDDASDPGDAGADTSHCGPVASSGDCSLREAIMLSNNDPALDTIVFSMATGTLDPLLDPFPNVTAPVTIDGYTQPGSAVATDTTAASYGVRLHGFANFDVLRLSAGASGSTLRGLDLVTTGVTVHTALDVATDANNVRVEGSRFNGGNGVFWYGENGVFGGTNAAARNVVVGGQAGLGVFGPGMVVQGNYFGVEGDGVTVSGNAIGISVSAGDALIGGAGALGNLIVGSSNVAVSVSAIVQDIGDIVRIAGNRFGYSPSNPTLTTFRNAKDVSVDAGNVQIGGAASEGNAFCPGSPGPSVSLLGITALVESNRMGVTAASQPCFIGNELLSSRVGISVGASTRAFIGSAGRGNLIRQIETGISVQSGTATILSNDIGSDTLDSATAPVFGISATSAANVVIGGTGPSHGNLLQGNLTGIRLLAASTATILGNDIGGLVGNDEGIRVDSCQGSVTIGGPSAGEKNLIRNQHTRGLTVGSNSAPIVVSGNLIGGSGNIDACVWVNGSQSSALLVGNYIGTDVTGMSSADSAGVGLRIESNNVVVGGTGAGYGNVISGNHGDGIVVPSALPFVSSVGVSILGNFIGVGADGVTPLGNGGNGIRLANASSTQIDVGGGEAGAGNVIAHNGAHAMLPTAGNGVLVVTGARNAIVGNVIFDNVGLAIDLGGNGVTANDDGDADAGANDLLNFPVLTGAQSAQGHTAIEGRLAGDDNSGRGFRVDLFAAPTCDGTHGEAPVFLGAVTGVVSVGGSGAFAFDLPSELAPGSVVSATTTTVGQSLPFAATSELSACFTVTAPGTLAFATDALTFDENAATSVEIVRTLGSKGLVSVVVQSTAGTAQDAADFAPVNQTVTFADGEVSKTVMLAVVGDYDLEPNETLTLTLTGPSGGALLGATGLITVTLANDDSCGDGFVGAGEECDGAATGCPAAFVCSPTCTCVAPPPVPSPAPSPMPDPAMPDAPNTDAPAADTPASSGCQCGSGAALPDLVALASVMAAWLRRRRQLLRR